MKNKYIIALALLIIVALIIAEPVYAGPGGFVAKGISKSWWGKLLLLALAVIFLPLIIYIRSREYLSVRQNMKVLSKLGFINTDFRWSFLEKNTRNIYGRVYTAWSKENLEEVSSLVSSWYWQNQQLVVLDEWKRNNLKNICRLQSVGKVRPLHLEITDQENLEGSRIAFSIEAKVEDYLVNRDTRTVVYGEMGIQDDQKIWILEYTNGNWLLDEIREGELSLAFAKMKNIIPDKLPNPIRESRASIR
ncbi:MAG: hypothetical protein ACI8XB_001751 [Patiriisocius sp.]|jgi:hypothetical protein